MIVTIVGELNPYGTDPRYALFDEPVGASGHRLRNIMGLRRPTYFNLQKVNLCSGRWSGEAAIQRASEIAREWRGDTHAPIVLLGVKVAAAFGVEGAFSTADGEIGPTRGVRFVLLPHPSGLCRAWNEPGAVDRARALLRAEIPSVPWGEADETRESA